MKKSFGGSPQQLAGWLVVLAICWLVWSGLYKPLLIGLGVFSCLLSLWIANRAGFFRHAMPLNSMLALPSYWAWLVMEIVKSSVEVARIVLSPSLPIQPSLVEYSTKEKSDSGKVILGNSITLTPGTVTIDLDENRLLVHCLTANTAADLSSGEMERRILKLGIN